MITSTMFECESCPKKFQYQNAADQHMRDKVHYKKKNENENERRCMDWVYSNTSNVHVAKDRGWFTEYTSFETEMSDFAGGKSQIVGVGTVELPIDPPPGFVREDSPRILRLTTVLHAPSILCNIIGRPIMDDYKISYESQSTKGFIMDRDGQRVAYFDPCRPLSQVKLRNPPSGYYALNHMDFHSIQALWSDAEREKWHAHQNIPGESFSLPEKMWLKKRFGNEFSFLRQFGMSIYKDENRERSRIILRTLMQADEKNDL